MKTYDLKILLMTFSRSKTINYQKIRKHLRKHFPECHFLAVRENYMELCNKEHYSLGKVIQYDPASHKVYIYIASEDFGFKYDEVMFSQNKYLDLVDKVGGVATYHGVIRNTIDKCELPDFSCDLESAFLPVHK